LFVRSPQGGSTYNAVTCVSNSGGSTGTFKVGCDAACGSCTFSQTFTSGVCQLWSVNPPLSFVVDCSAAGRRGVGAAAGAAAAALAALALALW
jgi:hypothetical protein